MAGWVSWAVLLVLPDLARLIPARSTNYLYRPTEFFENEIMRGGAADQGLGNACGAHLRWQVVASQRSHTPEC